MAKVKDFRPARVNANKHTARGMGALQKSIQSDGWIGAMTTAADGEMIAGSARIETVAQVWGTDAEPIVVESDGTRPVLVVRTDIPNADDKRAQRLALADNRVHEIDMSWDVEVLAGFDADVIGELWTPEELSDLGQQWADEQRGTQEDAGAQIDKAEELRVKWGVESGQLWQLGEHRLICGDCTDAATVARVMGGEKADMVFTDPPYGVDYEGGRNPVSNVPRAKISGDTSGALYEACLSATVPFCEDSAAWYLWFAATVGKPVYEAVASAGYTVRAMIIWNKIDAHYGNFMAQYMQKHEPCLYCVKKPPVWHGPTNEVTVWDVKQPTKNENHPTEKPVELADRAITNSSDAGAIVADWFLGSGTTLIACERLGRKCRAVEISPAYCAVALERWAQTTGKTPILANGA